MTWPRSLESVSSSWAAPLTHNALGAEPIFKETSTRWWALTVTPKDSGAALKAFGLGSHLVLSDLHIRNLVGALGVGLYGDDRFGVEIQERDAGVGECRSGGIVHVSQNGCGFKLCR